MSVNQAATRLVIGVGRQTVVDIELPAWFHRFTEGTNQAVHLFLSGLRPRHRVGASQTRQILSKAVAGNEGMKIIHGAKVIGVVIPAAHVGSRSRHPFALPERLQQCIFVEVQEQIVIVVELTAEQTVKQLNL